MKNKKIAAQNEHTSRSADLDESRRQCWAQSSMGNILEDTEASASVGPRFVLRKRLNQLIVATLLQAQIEFEIAKPYYRKDP